MRARRRSGTSSGSSSSRVEHVPQPGEIVHATETWAEAAGGGAVAAVQLAKLGWRDVLLHGARRRRARAPRTGRARRRRACALHVAWRDGAAAARRHLRRRRAASGRSPCIGDKHRPRGEDGRSRGKSCSETDCVYFTGRRRPTRSRKARHARVLVATARELATLRARRRRARRARRQRDRRRRALRAGRRSIRRRGSSSRRPDALGGWAQPGGPFAAAPPPGAVRGRLRRRRLLRRRAHVRARPRRRAARRARLRGTLRRGRRHRAAARTTRQLTPATSRRRARARVLVAALRPGSSAPIRPARSRHCSRRSAAARRV